MKENVKQKLVANGLFITKKIAILCIIISLTGCFLSFERKNIIKVALCGIGLLVFRAIAIQYLPRAGDYYAANKTIRIIGIILIAFASMVLFCTFVSDIMLATCDAIIRCRN